MASKHEWYVIGRGLAGWHASGINVSSTGGDLEPRAWWAGGMTTGYLAEAVDGCLIYDASEADARAFTAFILSGPMVDPKLQPGEIARFTDQAAAARMAPLMSGGFKTLATRAATDRDFHGLDSVSVSVYRGLLAAVPGMKLGTVQGGVIVWDEQPVLPGAEGVRAQEVAHPQFELPGQSFELTAPAETAPAQSSFLSGWALFDTSTEAE